MPGVDPTIGPCRRCIATPATAARWRSVAAIHGVGLSGVDLHSGFTVHPSLYSV
jgi:hypothetical protein